MGNDLCSCTNFQEPWHKKLNHSSNSKQNNVQSSQSVTPYENEAPNKNESKTNCIESKQNNIENSSASPEYQPIVPSSCTRVTKHPSFQCSTGSKEDDSVFGVESECISPESPNNEYGCAIYEFILKDFLTNNFPMTNDTINEMSHRNLLTPNDASWLSKLRNEADKAELFWSKFIFSEVNLCKVANFLFILISEKSDLFSDPNNSELNLHSVIDHIYYVINFICLLQNYSNETERIKYLIYHSGMFSINEKKSNSTALLHQKNYGPLFYIRIHLDNIELPSVFWPNFSKINQDFSCCQELIISSCNLSPDDTCNLVQGLKSSNILKLLDVSTNPITDTGLKHIQSLFQVENNRLESINLTCCSLTAQGVEEFLEILTQSTKKFRLKSLSLSHNDLDDMSESSILILTRLSLTKLDLQFTNMKYQKSLFESLKLNYSLKYLDISRNRLFNKDLTYLASGLAYNSNLRVISLSMMGLSRNDCKTINNTFLMNKSLVSIDLSDNSLGDEGIEILKDVFVMKKGLKEIILKRCNISLQGILLLLRQASDPDCHLKLLDLCYNRCPRMSLIFESSEILRKIHDILHHMGLVKSIKVLLWGTLDLSAPYYENIDF